MSAGTDHPNTARGSKPAQGTRKGKDKEPGPGPIRTSITSSHRVNKLAPSRPFPTVFAAVSATGPRSAHQEGKNYITITRKTKLGAYLRRCKDLVLKDGCVRSRSQCSLDDLTFSQVQIPPSFRSRCGYSAPLYVGGVPAWRAPVLPRGDSKRGSDWNS